MVFCNMREQERKNETQNIGKFLLVSVTKQTFHMQNR